MWFVVRRHRVPGCSAQLWLPSQPRPRGAGSAAPGLVGTDQQESEFCILHSSSLSSGQSDCIWDQPIVLHETVSPHLCLDVFSRPAVNKAGSGVFALLHVRGGPRSQTRSAASEPKLKFLLPDSGSRAYQGVMGRSNFGMTDSGSLFRDAYLRFLRSLAWHVSSTKLI